MVNFMVQEGGKFIYLALRAELHCQFVLGVARWPQGVVFLREVV